jgi:hippurate hydrolase
MKLVPEVAALLPEIKAWRHHIHAHPETAFEETATSAFVADKLRSFGLDVHTGLAKIGVVGALRGRSGTGAIGLRADPTRCTSASNPVPRMRRRSRQDARPWT